MKKQSPESSAESGNVLFYILIAITLIASLSYAVSSSNRGIHDISDDRAKLYAGEIIDYANIISNAVAQLRLRGCSDTEISFENNMFTDYTNTNAPSDDSCDIFDLNGGALQIAAPTPEAMNQAASPDNEWHIYADNEVNHIGTTSSAASSADLILVTDELKASICQQINALSGVTNANTAPPTDTDIGETQFTGSYSYTATIGDESSALSGQSTGCFQNTTDNKYVFYKVLIAR